MSNVTKMLVGLGASVVLFAAHADADPIYTIKGSYAIFYPNADLATGTFVFQVIETGGGAIDPNAFNYLTVVAPGDTTPPFYLNTGDQLAFGPVASTTYDQLSFNSPNGSAPLGSLNFRFNSPTLESNGTGTAYSESDGTSNTIIYASVSGVSISTPEPAALSLLGVGALGLLRRRRDA